MSVGIFIGNLNYLTEAEALKKHLEQFGSIEKCEVILDKFTFRSKGFARAEASDSEAAQNIINGASGTLLDGRPLKVELFTGAV